MGLDPFRFLNTNDGFERGLMVQIAKMAYEYRLQFDKNLAVEIANAVVKAFNG